MADQGPSDVASMVGDTGPAAAPAAHAGHHGRPVSWAAVIIITTGFVAGGTGLVTGPTWWLFWAGVGITVFGGTIALGSGILDDWY